jgi:hypothetical protein
MGSMASILSNFSDWHGSYQSGGRSQSEINPTEVIQKIMITAKPSARDATRLVVLHVTPGEAIRDHFEINEQENGHTCASDDAATLVE